MTVAGGPPRPLGAGSLVDFGGFYSHHPRPEVPGAGHPAGDARLPLERHTL